MSTIRSLDPGAREALLRELSALAARLVADLGADAVYLFGSLARGEQHEGSDIDPLVVRPKTLERCVREGHPPFARIMVEALRLA